MSRETVIVYVSTHHGNTRKLLEAIAAENEVVLADVSNGAECDLTGYDRIGIASGVAYGKYYPQMLKFLEKNLPEDKEVFFIHTAGDPRESHADRAKAIAEAKGCRSLGVFFCKGFDTYGPFKLVGGINKTHPDEDDIRKALQFYRELPEADTDGFTIRPETEADFRAVEELVREAFWNVYRPGCSEHYVIHVLRDDPAFVKELDFVMEKDGRLIGQNMFMKTVIEADDGRVIPVLTMGPIGITPELKRKGYGKILLDDSLEKAAKLGFGAVLFEGNIEFYGKSGFDYARRFGIRYHDLPEGADDSFFLCRELVPGYLDGITGVYRTPRGYYVDDADVEEFDKGFPPKEKQKLPGQIFG